VNRLFDNFFGQPSPSGLMERAVTPPVDMYESGSGATRRARRATTVRSAGSSGRFRFRFPSRPGRSRPTYRDGVLTVKLPKTEGVKPKEIKIDAA
jgi:HSP20 family molecular chaperone IbpA